MQNEELIRVNAVGKKFCRSLKKSLWYGATDVLAEALPFISRDTHSDNLRPDEFWAVDGVSFSVCRGQCVALLGRNGAGKTTLLKMLNGLIKPDRGSITMRGRVGAIIALGAGFNPILSGRENIYINASVLGLTRAEIDNKIEEIIDFSEIRESIDSPVQSYSSGMQVRLGFAVATCFEPDVLLLDEVLAVGDAPFRAKCYTRIGELMKKAAVILVSHDINTIGQTCGFGVVMERGKQFGGLMPISEALSRYDQTSLDAISVKNVAHFSAPVRWALATLSPSVIKVGACFSLYLDIDLAVPVERGIFRVTVFSLDDRATVEWNSLAQSQSIDLESGLQRIELTFGPLYLRSGHYEVSILLADSTGLKMLYLWHRGIRIKVEGSSFGQAPVQIPGKFSVTPILHKTVPSTS